MNKLSAVIITRNEEENLPRCLDSVKFADEIVVVDSGSTDRTLDIAREFGATVCETEWRGFGFSKRDGVAKATGDWVLSIDADEEVSAELAEEIQAVVRDSHSVAGFHIPRRTEFLGRWIMHSGWYPDPVLRLFRKECGNFDEALVPEKVILEGETGLLKNDLLHYSYPSLEDYFRKFNRYTSLAAREAHQNGRKVGVRYVLVNPLVKFVKQYVVKGGFLDGLEGLILAILSACYVMVKYAKIRDLVRRENTGKALPG